MAKKPGENDYTSGTKSDEKAKPAAQVAAETNKLRWWDQAGSQCANSIGSTVDQLQKYQAPRIRQQVINQALYGNRRLNGAQAAARARLMSQQSPGRSNLITYNATQSVIDTNTSKIGENKPRPFFLTSGGNYKQQRKAKKLNKYVEGVFYENKTYELTPQMFRDAQIDGDGFIHVYEQGGKIKHQGVSGLEIWIDEEEGQYGKPRNLHRAQVVDREELAALFPESKTQIMAVAKAKDAARGQTVADMVSIVSSWHIGSLMPDGSRKGGKYAVALLGGDGHMLVEPEDWTHDFFPFARMPWCAPPTGCGFWAQGLAEQLQSNQIELNKLSQLEQRSMQLSGNLIVWTKFGSKLVKDHLTNEIGTVITSAEKPEFFCPDPISKFIIERRAEIKAEMYQLSGVSELSASAKKPPGLNSGVAQREYLDNESDRFKHTQKLYDAAHLMLAEITVALAIEAADAGRLEAVRVPGKMSFDTIDFRKDLKGLKRSEFTLHCHSINRLPKDPAGQLQTIQEFVQAGIISMRRAVKLIDFPDLESEVTMMTAQENVIEMALESIVDDGKYIAPEPTDNLSLAQEMVIQAIAYYRTMDLEDDRLNMLRTFSAQVEDMLAMSVQAATPQGGPQAAPMAPPQSELLPNAPGMKMAA